MNPYIDKSKEDMVAYLKSKEELEGFDVILAETCIRSVLALITSNYLPELGCKEENQRIENAIKTLFL